MSRYTCPVCSSRLCVQGKLSFSIFHREARKLPMTRENDIYEGIWLEYLLQSQACIFGKASLKYPHTLFLGCFSFRVDSTLKQQEKRNNKQTNKQTPQTSNFMPFWIHYLKPFIRMSRNELVCNNSVLLPMALTNNVRRPHLERFVSIFIYSYIIYSEIIYSHFNSW